jgi:hypothetical protein
MATVMGTGRWRQASMATALAMLALLGTTCGDDNDGASDARPADTAPSADRAGDSPPTGGASDTGTGAPDGPATGGMCEPCAATCTSDTACDAPGRCAKFGNGCTACLFCKTAETCGNDIDDDCDGVIDQGCAPCPGKGSCAVNQVCVPPA